MLTPEYCDWISRAGVVAPGIHVVPETLFIPRGRIIRGQENGTSTISSLRHDQPCIELEGALEKVYVSGGGIGVNVSNGADGARLYEVSIGNTLASPGIDLWVGSCSGFRAARCVFHSAKDNGVQVEDASDYEFSSCAWYGTFGNKALDCSHGIHEGGRLVHITVVAENGFGVGLGGWHSRSDGNAMVNCLIATRAPGAGAVERTIYLPNGIDCGDFRRNLIAGRLAGIPADLSGPFPTPDRDAIDVRSTLTDYMPAYWQTHLGAEDRIRPANNSAALNASLRTLLSKDLGGHVRWPLLRKHGLLAIGAVAAPHKG